MRIALVILGLVAFPIAMIALSRVAVSSQWVASGVYTLTWIAMLLCVIAASASRGRRRCIACGGAVFALSYFFFAVLVSDAWVPAARFFGIRTAPQQMQLATTLWLAWTYDQVTSHYMEIWTSGRTRAPALHLMTVSAAQIPKDMDLSTLEAFIRTGQCMFTWMAGAAGGVLGGWFYAQRSPADRIEPGSVNQ